MNTPKLELDRSCAEFIARLEADGPMMQAPERRCFWPGLCPWRAHWRYSIFPENLPATSAFELSRWRDGRCCMGFPRALLSV